MMMTLGALLNILVFTIFSIHKYLLTDYALPYRRLRMTAADNRLIISDMTSPAATVRHPTTSALLLLEFASERGLAAEQALRGTDLSLPLLRAAGAEIRADQELTLIRNVVAHFGNPPGLGLEMGLRYHLTAYGIWGYALISSPSMRQAIETGLRYLDLTYSFLRIHLEDHGSQTRLVLDDELVGDDVRRFLVERDTAAIVTILHELFAGQQPPAQVCFAFPPPPDIAAYTRLFGCSPQFNASENSYTLDRQLLEQALPQANPLSAQLCEVQCRQLLAQRRARVGLAMQVRDQLVHGIGSSRMPNMEAVAAELLLTSRTLRRRLELEGTSFRALIDEVRQALAEELLSTAHLKVDAVAARLGYSEAASFLHARKRWRSAQHLRP